MYSRRFVGASGLGTALGAAMFFIALEAALDDGAWVVATIAGVLFGVFMAAWNGSPIRLDAKQRTTRNVIFESVVAQWIALMGVAWLLARSLEHLRWQELTVYTLVAIPLLGIVWLITRRNIKGEPGRELFA